MMNYKQRAAVILSQDPTKMNVDRTLELQSTRIEDGSFLFFNLRTSAGKDKIVSDDWYSININQCRHCKKEIAPYSENFFEYHPSLIDSFTLYCFENNYCKECAEALSHKKHNPPKQLIKTSYRQLSGDRTPTTIKYFADGSIEETNEAFGRKHKKH